MMRVHARRQSEASSFNTQDGPGDGSSASSTHSDDAMKLFAMAPWWVWCTRWHNPRPPTDPAQNSGSQQLEGYVFRPSGPCSADEMMQLYRSKRLKGSVLLVGLTQGAKEQCTAEDVPANTFRTLAHLFEMSKNGVPYSPVGVDGIRTGMSAASWGRPLWTISEPSLPGERRRSHAGADEQAAGAAGQSKAADNEDAGGGVHDGDSTTEGTEQDSGSEQEHSRQQEDLTIKLLTSAPSWCYLYSHEPLKSKKTPPKSSAYMVEMYRAGCLPDWTPMLGLREEVAHFNSLPPSLFTPLSALVTVLKAGLELQPVGQVELQRYDKFIESRTHSGITMRTPNSDSKPHSSSHTPGNVTPTRGAKAQSTDRSAAADNLASSLHSLPPLSKSASGKTSSQANGTTSPSLWTPTHSGPEHDSYSMSAQEGMSQQHMQQQAMMHHMSGMGMGKYNSMGPTWLSWGFPPVNPYPYHMSSPSSSPARGLEHTSSSPAGGNRRAPGSPGAGGRVSPAHRLANHSGSGQKGYKQQQQHGGSPPGSMHALMQSPSSPIPGSMHDPSFAQGGMWAAWPHYPPPVAPAPPTCTWTTPVFKLFMADVSRGSSMPAWWYMEADNEADGPVGPIGCEAMIMMYAHGSLTDQHLVCGTHADVTLASPPGREFFEELTKLLHQVQQGGQYMLVSLAEVTQHPARSSTYQNGGSPWHKSSQNGNEGTGNGPSATRTHHAGMANGHLPGKPFGSKGHAASRVNTQGTNSFFMAAVGISSVDSGEQRGAAQEPSSPPASAGNSQSGEDKQPQGLGSPFVSRLVAAAAVAEAEVQVQGSGVQVQEGSTESSDPQTRDQAPKSAEPPAKEPVLKGDEHGGFGSTEIHIPDSGGEDLRASLEAKLCSCAGLTPAATDAPSPAVCSGTPLPAA